MRRQALRRRVHIREIGVTVATAGRRSDRDEHQVGLCDSLSEIDGKAQTAP